MQKQIDAFITSCRAAGLSSRTLDWYAANLAAFSAFCVADGADWRAPDALRSFIAALQSRSSRFENHSKRPAESGGLSIATIRGYVRTLKRFYHWCCDEELLTVDPTRRLVMPKAPRRVPRGIALADFQRLLEKAGTRDRAVLLVLADTGCRVSELCGMRRRDVDLTVGKILVLGKGQQERFVFLTAPTCEALKTWLSEAPDHEYLFVGQRGERFKASTVTCLLRRLKVRAGVTGRCNPHSFRHGFAREYLLRGGDLASLSAMLGHGDLQTTMIYSLFAADELRQKHDAHSAILALELTQ